jgi:D-alanyl-D-alanine carboxypeptidase
MTKMRVQLQRYTQVALTLLSVCVLSCRDEYLRSTEACEYTPSQETLDHPKAERFRMLIEEYTKAGLPGIVLLINDAEGTWVGSSGKADIAKGIDMKPCHISKAASITKMFVAVAAFKLVEEGKLSLDEKAAALLPHEVADRITNVREVTLRQLLNHTTGIYDIIDDDAFYLAVLNDPTRKRSLSELAEFVYDKPAVFAPGTKAAYSNTNTLLVSMMIEKATGKEHHVVIRERIITPLNLNDTFYNDFVTLPTNTAQGYYDLYQNNTIVNLSNYNTASGYGGLYSSVFDLRTFIEALLVKKTLLTETSLDEMLVFSPDVENGKQMGAGIFRDFLNLGEENYAYGHRGRDLAFTADLFYFPNHHTTMALLMNYGTDAETDLREVFLELREQVAKAIVHE